MALGSDKARRASAPLSRKSNRDSSASWTISHDQRKVSIHKPLPLIDENTQRAPHARSIESDTDIEEETSKKAQSSKRGPNNRSSASGLLGEPADDRRRKALRTSQHTTIIHRRHRSKSGSHLATYLEAPQPRANHQRAGLLVSDNLNNPDPRSKLQVRSKKGIDDLRRDVEIDFYEHVDHEGTVRRRSMIRNVSRDDYLLARGANPRTGIITPGTHSASSSFDETGILRARDIAPPAKWRQRGDEWISLEFGQPTPAPTPPAGQASYASQRLRTPQRFASDEHVPEVRSSPASRGQTIPNASAQTPIATPTGVPGTYPQTPSDANKVAFATNAAANHSIPRKPIGSPSSRGLDQQYSAGNVAAANANPAVKDSHPVSSARSSSAPSAPKSIPNTPADIGKNLPPLPSQDNPQLINNTAALPLDNPFLGQRGTGQSRSGHNFATSGTFGPPMQEKELPCPPTNNGQSQSPQSQQSMQMVFENLGATTEPPKHNRVLGPRGMNPEYPYIRTSRPKMRPSMEMCREHPRGARPMPVPFYDNPPHPQLEPPRSQRMPVRDPRMMSRSHHLQPNEIDDVFNVRPTTTTMNTGTFMSIEHRGRKRHLTVHPNPQVHHGTGNEGAMPQNSPLRNGQGPRDMAANMNMNSGDLTSIPMSRSHPRVSSRPQMLGRAEGMHSIPRLRPARRNIDMISMEPPPQWNPTGMQHRSGIENVDPEDTVLHTSQPHKPIKDLQPGASITYPGYQEPVNSNNVYQTVYHQQSAKPHTSPESSGNNLPGAETSPLPGLTRQCSRCQNGYVKGRQRSIDGVIPVSPKHPSPAPLNTLREVTGEDNKGTEVQEREVSSPGTSDVLPPQAAPSAIAAQADHRDHTICCPECCKEQDCHEGCLGHPSPVPSPARSIGSSIDTTGSGNESPSSARDSDAQSNTSEKVRVGRLAFMRSAFRKGFKDRPSHSRDNSKNSIHSKKSLIAELDTPPIDLSTHPLSPGAFWGSEATGATGKAAHAAAVEAAKSAIGLKKQPSVSSDNAVPAPSPLRVKKTRRKKSEISDVARNLTAPTTTPATNEGERHPSPNESRRVASGPSLRVPTPASNMGQRSPSGRNASGASVATIEVHVPQFGNLGFSAVWEMILVPFDASKMWLRNHPQIMSLAWKIIEKAYEMRQIMTLTASRVWRVVFVYSKTGKLKMKRGDTAAGFMLDCMRSAVYLLIFMAIGVAVMRVAKWVLNIVGVLGMIVNGVVWVVKRLLGYGLFW